MAYKNVTKEDIAYFVQILDSERVLYESIPEEYAHDELSHESHEPECVLKPKTTQEVSKIMSYAYEKEIPVTVRGTGTGLVGAAVPICGGIVLDFAPMNQILELDEDNLTLTVEPGVLLMDIASYVEERGYFYPPDPGEKSATIGGNISTNAGGMRAVKYGVTRDYVRALELVLPNGEILQCGSKVVKNSSGYDLKDLVAGSEGTLAVITKAILKLLPKPEKTISLLVPFHSLKEAIQIPPIIVRSKVVPTAIEFMERQVVEDSEVYLGTKFPEENAQAYLLVKFDANTDEDIEHYCEIVSQICMDGGAYDVLLSNTEEREETVWKARGAFLEAIKSSTSEIDEVDVVVPRSDIYSMIEMVIDLVSERNIRIKLFGHAGDGNLHIYVLRDNLDEKQWQEQLSYCMDRMYERGYSLRGQVSGEHGIGLAKKAYFCRTANEEALRIMRGIKAVFDPKNILNPGKIF